MCARCGVRHGNEPQSAPPARLAPDLGGCAARIGIAIVIGYLFPVYWMFISGLKTSAEIFADPPSMVPQHPTLAAFRYVFERENVARYMRNSLAIAIPVTVLTLVLGSSGGYALSRLRTPLVDVALVVALILQIFPDALLATPMFIMFRHFNLLNTFTGGGAGDQRQVGGIRAGDPAADVPPGADGDRGGLARGWLQHVPDVLAHRAADHARAADRRWCAELRAGVWPVRLSADAC